MQKKIEKVSETNEIRVRNLTNSNNTHSYTQSHIEARTNLSSWSGGFFYIVEDDEFVSCLTDLNTEEATRVLG